MASIFQRKGRPGWYVVYSLPNGKRKIIGAGTNHKTALAVKSKVENDLTLPEHGVLTTSDNSIADATKLPITAHIADYIAHLTAAECSAMHVANVLQELTDLFTGCNISTLVEINTHTVEAWLSGLMRNGLKKPGYKKKAKPVA